MASKQQNKRSIRKIIIRRFDEAFDLARLDYKKRTKPGKDIAKMTGLIFAAGAYCAAFSLAYYSWVQLSIEDEFFAKLVWLFMVPSSVVGCTAWLITANRREFVIREDVRAHITEFEGETGTLWRYEPLLEQLDLKNINIGHLVQASRDNKLVTMAPDEVCATVHALHQLLQEENGQANAISQAEQNWPTE